MAKLAKINAEEWNKYLVIGDAYLSDIKLLSTEAPDLIPEVSEYQKLKAKSFFGSVSMIAVLDKIKSRIVEINGCTDESQMEELDGLSQRLKTLPDLPATPNVKKIANAVSVTEVHASLYSRKTAKMEQQSSVFIKPEVDKKEATAVIVATLQ